MRKTRALLATMTLTVPTVLAASPALAAAPTNDVLAGATPISLGVSQVLDTTEATTDADDVAVNLTCGAPATDASVWYSFTPTVDSPVIVDVSTSTYSAGVIIATGDAAGLTTIMCGPSTVVFAATAGTAYSILAFDDQFDGGGNGGTLDISLSVGPAAPTIDVMIDRTGRVNRRSGIATLKGTYTCTDADFLAIEGELVQRVGRGTVNGTFSIFSEGVCDGTRQRFTVKVPANNGPFARFAPGRSAAVAFSFACGRFMCADGFTEQKVRLERGNA